ncbi:SpcZ [Streptomyces albofaciens JCM 4342]|uniref:SpcZ n=1 Tax=Streptomyces albofaciens TaxID=66866 RepID=UPI00123AB192|nr:SpcZ [Streptomyces albofaciens]KAA6212571.1 SpcZ [Streptomyces albofaciens JCM 4342]
MSSSPVATEAFTCFLAQLEAGGPGTDGGGAPDGGAGNAPAWFMPVVAALFDGQPVEAATDWARRVYGEVQRLEGRIPFGVVHDWHSRTVLPMLVAASVRRGGTGAELETVRDLHERALAGEPGTESEWAAALEPALREVYRLAYAFADAFATAAANARAYAAVNDYGEERAEERAGEKSEGKAEEFAAYYEELNTGAHARSFADAHALANSRAVAAAYANEDARAYAEAYPGAYVHAYALAEANREVADGQEDERCRTAYGRLADGLVGSLEKSAAS